MVGRPQRDINQSIDFLASKCSTAQHFKGRMKNDVAPQFENDKPLTPPLSRADSLASKSLSTRNSGSDKLSSNSGPSISQIEVVHRAYIALGSNVGDRISMIESACREMDRRGISVIRTSALYETEAMYLPDQQSFINGVCEVRQA